MALGKEPVGEMRAEKAGGTADQYPHMASLLMTGP
jgi:hypothetical protein